MLGAGAQCGPLGQGRHAAGTACGSGSGQSGQPSLCNPEDGTARLGRGRQAPPQLAAPAILPAFRALGS